MLCACPQHVEKIIDEALPPTDYRPVYLTSAVTFGALLKERGVTVGSGAEAREGTSTNGNSSTSTGTGTTGANASTTKTGKLALEIRNVDDRRYPEMIELRAFVYDEAGRFVMGLAPPYFAGKGDYHDYWRILVDSCAGTATAIDRFNVTEVREDRREPLAIGYALDHSSSMGELRTRKLRDAIQRTLKLIRRGDRVSVLSFTTKVTMEVPLTGDSATFRKKFRADDLSTYGGGTALYDGALMAIRELSSAPSSHRRSLIIFSDGADNDSDSTLAAVHRAAKQERITIYTIAYGDAEEGPLSELATYTGGKLYRIYSTKEFPFVFADIYRRMNNYYRITYRAPACRGMHTASSTLTILELQKEPLTGFGVYDQSVFTPFTEVGDVAFANIEFDYNLATIRPESMTWLNEVASSMKKYPIMKIEVRGHTDDVGGDEYNIDLSQRRARSVADALIVMGIDRTRLRVQGFGKTRPLVPNDSDANRTRNRRTEFVIVER
ncbi:MAG: OmpA family protein [bacterium]|nr:OmpA family protein [Candidatus Kapabacteria bacterium]